MTREVRGGGSAPPSTPRGYSLAETLVGLLLWSLLAILVLGTLAVQRRAQNALAREAEVLGGARVARHLLGAEIRGRGETGLSVAPDTLGVRSRRAWGIVCPGAPAGDRLVVLPAGVRNAVEGRDSVVVHFSLAEQGVRMLIARSGASCPHGAAGAAWEEWTLSAAVPAGAVFVGVFRRGSYHLADGALRYRVGGGGRQPITPEVFDAPSSAFRAVDAGLAVRLVPKRGPGWRYRITAPGG